MKRVLSLRHGAVVLTMMILAAGCGHSSSTMPCSPSVAVVGGTAVARQQYNEFLKYTLGFYEKGDPTSRYYGRKLCGTPTLASQCRSVKQKLLQRMIDQNIVAEYAAKHRLITSKSDWTAALKREKSMIRTAGGQSAFYAYLQKVGITQALFQWLAGQQIQTAKVSAALGPARFATWLRHQEHSSSVRRCEGAL